MNKRARGFTLIEIVIVVAIIAILSAVALPLLVRQQARAAEGACLSETKSYVTMSVAALLSSDATQAAPLKACTSGDTVDVDSTSITATPKFPGRRRTICSVVDAKCVLEP